MDVIVSNLSEVATGNKDFHSLIVSFLRSQNVCNSSKVLYARTLKQFFVWVDKANKNLSTISREDIIEYLEYLNNTLNLSSLTVGSYLVAVRKFFEYAESVKAYPNITKGIKTPRRSNMFEKGYLRDEKSKELLDFFKAKAESPLSSSESKARDYAIVNLMLRTGLRTIEVARAQKGDLDYIGGQRVLKVWGKGRLKSEKGKGFNFVVVTDKAYLPIKEYLEKFRSQSKDEDPLFSSVSHQNKGKGITTRTISGLCKEGLKAVGMDGKRYTAHSLRHTVACSLLEHGKNIIEVQRVLRHSSPTTTQIYTRMKEKELRLTEAPESVLDFAY